MGDPRRFDVFAAFIAALVPKARHASVRVADVAAGNGQLTFALRRHGFSCVTPFEPAPRRGGQVRRLGIEVRDFEPRDCEGFDLIVGMHPDAATDVILSGAALSGRTAAVVPCCAKSNAWTYWGAKRSRAAWREHLVERSAREGLTLETSSLQMTGANDVLFSRWSSR